ncbi:MAG: hypothetical protein DIU68_008890 [Chloroflexota bacterium]|nr:MAG: hypothetical protein DIU68_14860 [Chloroflexota bacterium]
MTNAPIVSLPLWRALRRPPSRNPLFRRTYGMPEQPFPWYVGCFQWLGVLFFLPILAIPGTIYGLGWAIGISHLIGKEREIGRFDLLSLCPPGPLGMSWAIATGYLYHHRTFRNIIMPGNLLFRVLLMALIVGGASPLFAPTMALTLGIADFALTILGAAAALVIDHVQSIAAAALVGMTAIGFNASRVNTQIVAFALYSSIQLITYLLTLIIGFVILPVLVDSLGITGTAATFVLVAARLLVFATTREMLLVLLWYWLVEQVNPDPLEARSLIGNTGLSRASGDRMTVH